MTHLANRLMRPIAALSLLALALAIAARADTPGTGTLTIHIEPPAAVAAGAQWSFDGVAWHDSGTTITVPAGRHGVDFRTLHNWERPWVVVNQWAFMGGRDEVDVPGIFGRRGVESAGAWPASRRDAATWTDDEGRLYLFSGVGDVAEDVYGWLNDLWRYDPRTGRWAWLHGTRERRDEGHRGTLGVAAPENMPGYHIFRANALAWTAAGDGWFFDGQHTMWRYLIAENMWVRVNEADEAFWVQLPAAVWTDDDDNLWLHDQVLWKFDTEACEWIAVMDQPAYRGTKGVAHPDNRPTRRSRPGYWYLDGRMWLYGGGTTRNDLWVFDSASGMWTWTHGSDEYDQPLVGEFGETSPEHQPAGTSGAVSWVGQDGHFYLFSGRRYGWPYVYPIMNQMWRYDPDTNQWAWISGPEGIPIRMSPQGIPTPDALPARRIMAAGWTGADGRFWMFGGHAVVTGYIGRSDRLWCFDPGILVREGETASRTVYYQDRRSSADPSWLD